MKLSFSPINHDIIAGCINKNRSCQKSLYKIISPAIFTKILEEGFSEIEAESLLQKVFFEILSVIDHYNHHIPFESWYLEVYENTLNNYFERK